MTETKYILKGLVAKWLAVFIAVAALLAVSRPFQALCGEGAYGTTVTVGIFPLDPLNYIDSNGKAQGFVPDLMRRIAKETGVDFRFVGCDWVKCIEKLKNGGIDMMVDVAYTPERASFMSYGAEPILNVWGQVYLPMASRVENLEDLNGSTVALMSLDYNGQNFRDVADHLGIKYSVYEVASHHEVFRAVSEGAAQAGIAPHFFGDAHAKEYGLREDGPHFSPFPVYFAMSKKGPTLLLHTLDDYLSRWKRDERSPYHDLMYAWLGESLPVKRELPPWVGTSALLVGCAMLLLLVAVSLLKKNLARKSAQLSASETKYRQIVEGVNSVILLWDKEGRINYMNRYGLDLFGYTPDEILGRHVVGTIVPETESTGRDLKEMIEDIIDNPERYLLNENENMKKDGSRVLIQWTNRSIFNEQGEFTEILSVGADITRQRGLEEQLRQAQKMEAIGTLAGGIAHDFNNILTAIMGFCQLALLASPTDSTLRGYLNQIETASSRARDLVSQILTFGRKTSIQPVPLHLDSLVKESMKMMRSTIPTTITIEQEIEGDVLVMADPIQMHQVIVNLCTNAYQAMKATGGTLKVTLTRERGLDEKKTPGGWAVLKVADTGPGMDEVTQRKIFEPYFTTKKDQGGTGLGLAVVHGIVASHNGEIEVESAPGDGTAFIVRLPLAQNVEEGEEKRPSKASLATGAGERILLVDDEEQIRGLGKALLETAGFTVETLGDGQSALEAFKADPHRYDVVISDMTMPRLDGAGLAASVKLIRPDIPVIICSGFSDSMDEEIAKEKGIDAFVLKPYTTEKLLRTISSVMGGGKDVP